MNATPTARLVKGPSVKGPLVKGWCPGAYRPMASGDGLVVRIRPWLGEVSAHQALVLCALAERYGTGALELTLRANIQLRGIAEHDHEAVLEQLFAAGLLDAEPAIEARRNLLMTPDWMAGDVSHTLAENLMAALPELPDLPAKFGYAIDTGRALWLGGAPADIRIERDASGGLILVADGASTGGSVTRATAGAAIAEMTRWFVETGGREAGRMARHLRGQALPSQWTAMPRHGGRRPTQAPNGMLLGAPFGQVDAGALRRLITGGALETLRVLPGRTLLAKGSSPVFLEGFCAPDDPLLNIHACTGAPGCSQALGPTRALARRLALDIPPGETLHISGCTKGCAHPRAADHTLIATNDGFDLVSQGAPWEAPSKCGLPADLCFKDIQT